MKSVVISALSAFLLSGCLLTEQQCATANWAQIGVSDGQKGRSSDVVSKHVNSCGHAGVSVDSKDWMRGWTQGNATYCTPQTIFERAKRGYKLREVCPKGDRAKLEAAFAKGHKYFNLTQNIEILRTNRNGLLRGRVVNGQHVGAGLSGFFEAQGLDASIEYLLIEREKYARL